MKIQFKNMDRILTTHTKQWYLCGRMEVFGSVVIVIVCNIHISVSNQHIMYLTLMLYADYILINLEK